jgi:hypothetical protein
MEIRASLTIECVSSDVNGSADNHSVFKRASNRVSQSTRNVVKAVRRSHLSQACEQVLKYVRDFLEAIMTGLAGTQNHPSYMYSRHQRGM